MNKIIFDGKLYAVWFNTLNSKEGLTFLTDDNESIQVGIWNYPQKKILDAHFHNDFIRESNRTCESVFVIKGKVKCNLYTKDCNFIESFVINENEIVIQFYGVHEYEILEDSIVLENKNGPYFGPDKDRTRVDVKKI